MDERGESLAVVDREPIGNVDAPIQATVRPEAAPATRTRGDGGPATVVIVEDEPDLRLTLRGLLKRDGRFQVVGEASDGLEGIELAVEAQPDVILLDLNMPRMDGREAGPKLFTRCPRSMIVVLSALDAAVEAQPAIARGAFAYVEKSEIGVQLGEGLADLLDRFRMSLVDGETIWAPISELEQAARSTKPDDRD